MASPSSKAPSPPPAGHGASKMERRMSHFKEYKFFRSFSAKVENWPMRKAEQLWRKMRERKIAAAVWGYPEKGLGKKQLVSVDEQLDLPEEPQQSILLSLKETGDKNEKSKSDGECKLTCTAALTQKAAEQAKDSWNEVQDAHMAKTQLPEQDLQSPKTSEEIAASKQGVIEQLKKEIKEAEAEVAEKEAAVAHQQQAVDAAMQFVELATAQV